MDLKKPQPAVLGVPREHGRASGLLSTTELSELRPHPILVTLLFKEKCIPEKEKDTALCFV